MEEVKPGKHCGMRWLSGPFCWQRCDRLLGEIYCCPAAVVKGRELWKRPPGLMQLTFHGKSL